ncbi:Cathepsin L [Geodia barretti]|nr:Cathepsin L [Geodia barretti]
MTDIEYKTKILTYRKTNTSSGGSGGPKVTPYVPDPHLSLPEALDWRSRGAVSAVKDQGSCGASYAFSTTGSIEGAVALGYGRLVSLSEQNIIDCSVPLGNNGCNGGNMYNSFMYIIDNGGIDTSYAYPYQGSQTGCSFDRYAVGADITGIISIREGSEYHLQTALASAGPISIAVDASTNSFRFYDGGVFDSFRCSSTDVNHAMTLIGYGTYNGKEHWMVKNSWGTSWGVDGYIMMTRNYYNQCGIASDASYPSL